MPEDFRPDRSGVIVHLEHKWRGWNVILAIPAGRTVPSKSLEWLRHFAKQVGRPLVFDERLMEDGDYIGLKRRAYGSAAFADHVKRTVGPEDLVKMEASPSRVA